jgi:probable phosphoglycerate mutase
VSGTASGVRQHRYAVPPGATQLLLVRHGESAPVVDGEDLPRWNRQADPPLHPDGQAEADRVADRLRHEAIDAVYTSPLTRTRQTAAPLAEALGLTPIVDDDLREVFLGDVDGLNLGRLVGGDDGVRRALREQRWELLPGAEPQHEFSARVRLVVERIAAAHPGGAVAVFAHGGVIGQVLAEATGSALHAFIGADNGSISHLVVAGRRWTVRAFNDTGHLRDLLLAGTQPLVG